MSDFLEDCDSLINIVTKIFSQMVESIRSEIFPSAIAISSHF